MKEITLKKIRRFSDSIKLLIQEFFCGDRTPFSPHKLLYMIWTHAHHLAGYEQQDAHEFFIATLDLLHRHLIYRTNIPPSSCTCIVDTIFTGKLQSDVVCQVGRVCYSFIQLSEKPLIFNWSQPP